MKVLSGTWASRRRARCRQRDNVKVTGTQTGNRSCANNKSVHHMKPHVADGAALKVGQERKPTAASEHCCRHRHCTQGGDRSGNRNDKSLVETQPSSSAQQVGDQSCIRATPSSSNLQRTKKHRFPPTSSAYLMVYRSLRTCHRYLLCRHEKLLHRPWCLPLFPESEVGEALASSECLRKNANANTSS